MYLQKPLSFGKVAFCRRCLQTMRYRPRCESLHRWGSLGNETAYKTIFVKPHLLRKVRFFLQIPICRAVSNFGHCEPVRTLVWQSPTKSVGLPRRCAPRNDNGCLIDNSTNRNLMKHCPLSIVNCPFSYGASANGSAHRRRTRWSRRNTATANSGPRHTPSRKYWKGSQNSPHK